MYGYLQTLQVESNIACFFYVYVMDIYLDYDLIKIMTQWKEKKMEEGASGKNNTEEVRFNKMKLTNWIKKENKFLKWVKP